MLQDITNDLLYVLSILESIGKLSKYTGKYTDPEVFFDAEDQMPSLYERLSLSRDKDEVSICLLSSLKLQLLFSDSIS